MRSLIDVPGKYHSDFAGAGHSQVDGAQQHAINFTNNNLLGSANFIPSSQNQQSAVCSHGNDDYRLRLPDISISDCSVYFSPTDFVQMKAAHAQTRFSRTVI